MIHCLEKLTIQQNKRYTTHPKRKYQLVYQNLEKFKQLWTNQRKQYFGTLSSFASDSNNKNDKSEMRPVDNDIRSTFPTNHKVIIC